MTVDLSRTLPQLFLVSIPIEQVLLKLNIVTCGNDSNKLTMRNTLFSCEK